MGDSPKKANKRGQLDKRHFYPHFNFVQRQYMYIFNFWRFMYFFNVYIDAKFYMKE